MLHTFLSAVQSWGMEDTVMPCIAYKLGFVFELLRDYRKASYLSECGIAIAEKLRHALSHGNRSSLSCDSFLHVSTDANTEVGSIYELACVQGDLWMLLCRANIRQREQDRLDAIVEKQRLFERIGAKYTPSDDSERFEIWNDEVAGSDPYRRASFWVALLSLKEVDLGVPTKVAGLFEKASAELHRAYASEKKVLGSAKTVRILERGSDFLLVEAPERSDATWVKVYCREGTVGTVSSKDVSFPGTGTFSLIANKDGVKISGLTFNKSYSFAISYFDQGKNALLLCGSS